jgi:hypothetical protein
LVRREKWFKKRTPGALLTLVRDAPEILDPRAADEAEH